MKLSLSGTPPVAALVFVAGLWLMPSMGAAQQKYIVEPIAEMKVNQLPKGELFWRLESFPTLDAAKTAAPPYRWNPDTVSFDGLPSLSAEVAGKAWLFTLGPKGGSTGGGTKVAEIGPVPPLSAPEYLLRVNYGHGPPGSTTPVHMHPGSETFYVVAGRLGQRTPQGVMNVEVGHSMNGHAAGTTMEVFNSGTTELEALIMFVVDATSRSRCRLSSSKAKVSSAIVRAIPCPARVCSGAFSFCGRYRTASALGESEAVTT